MVKSSDEAQRPASRNEDADTSSARRQLRLQDGGLSVTVFTKLPGKSGQGEKTHTFIVPERAYRDGDDKWVNTHLLHIEDLLPMARLLIGTYDRLRQSESETGPADK